MTVGVDIVDHSRIKLEISSKILNKREQETFNNIKIEKLKIQYLASRFAAKEAIIKATNKKYLISEIEIIKNEDDSVKSNIDGIALSISHESKFSIAFAIYSKI